MERSEFIILEFLTTSDNWKNSSITRRISSGRYLWDKLSETNLPIVGVNEGDGMGATLEYMLTKWSKYTHEKVLIHSVKRLSDGVIFKIGDKLFNVKAGKEKAITKINLTENNVIQFELDKYSYDDIFIPTILLKNAFKRG